MSYGESEIRVCADRSEREWNNLIEETRKILIWLDGFGSSGKTIPPTYGLKSFIDTVEMQVKRAIENKKTVKKG